MRAIEAEFQNGFLKPTEPLPLRSGEHVNFVVLRKADPKRWDLQKLARTSQEDFDLAGQGVNWWAESLGW